MSGHSKWSQIKRDKAKTDSAKGKVYTKMAREIIIAAKNGGGDPAGNPRLRSAIERSREAGLPNENIKRAILKGTGELAADQLEEIRYEGYGPAGTAVLIEAMTENRNRTVADLRMNFTKYGGNLGETGCVGWMFRPKGQITIAKNDGEVQEDDLMMAAADAGAEDVKDDGEAFIVQTETDKLTDVEAALRKAGYKIEAAELAQVPENMVQVEDVQQAAKLFKLLDALENHDDIQNVYSNFDVPDAVMSELEAATR